MHSLIICTPYTFLLENKYIPCTIIRSDVNSEIQFIHLANLQKTVFSIDLEISSGPITSKPQLGINRQEGDEQLVHHAKTTEEDQEQEATTGYRQ